MKQTLWQALDQNKPLQVVGTINAYTALLAKRAGHSAIYLSGAGVANASLGLPDLAMSTLNDVCTDVRRIKAVCDLPLLVDADTGWGSALMLARAVKDIERAGAAGLHLEDQVQAKRCGHRPNKQLVSSDEMCDRIKAAVYARTNKKFVIMARTDAHAVEGLDAAIKRAQAYVASGADMIFAEALTTEQDFKTFIKEVKVPVLANMTEFGKTPMISLEQFNAMGVSLVLYPLSAFRAMNQAALNVYTALKQHGSQESMLNDMQTRDELYDVLGYHAYEKVLDDLFKK